MKDWVALAVVELVLEAVKDWVAVAVLEKVADSEAVAEADSDDELVKEAV